MAGDDKDLDLGSIFPVSETVCPVWTLLWHVASKEESRPPSPSPSFDFYHRETENRTGNWSSVEIRLVGSHPLWGHYLYTSNFDESIKLHQQLTDSHAQGGTPQEPLQRISMPTPRYIRTEEWSSSALVVDYQGLLPLSTGRTQCVYKSWVSTWSLLISH